MVNERIRRIPFRAVGEWALQSDHVYGEPFVDVQVDARFTAPSGRVYVMPGFYDGDGTWRLRFSPDEAGTWRYRTVSRPTDPDLDRDGIFEVTGREARGFLEATPNQAWGFQYESGEPVFLLGDTVYNLFGMAHCGGNVEGFLRRRAEQGFNVFRVRCQVSPFHPPDGHSTWQTHSTWPWGGSEQSPRFDRFNLDWFRTVDRVVRAADAFGIGFEMIMEAWGFEYPFNNRAVFVPEWEELWLRYLIARYDAYSSVYFWTLMNEYEYYPNGDWRYNAIADRWAMRIGRWVKATAPHGHVVSVHNGPQMPPFAKRFEMDPGAVDAIMFQVWGTTGEEDGWLAAGIDKQIRKSFAGWRGSAVFAEYGYERNPDLPLTFPGFDYCDGNHTRRGAWRGAFCAMGVINGFEDTWGPVMNLEEDQEGVVYLRNLKRFFTQVVRFEELAVAHELVLPGTFVREHKPGPRVLVKTALSWGRNALGKLLKQPPSALPGPTMPNTMSISVLLGHKPLAMASENRDLVVVYLPAAGDLVLDLPGDGHYSAQWYDPRAGELSDAIALCVAHPSGDRLAFEAPGGADRHGHPWDWVLLLQA